MIWASWSQQLDKYDLMVVLEEKQATGLTAGAQNTFRKYILSA
jgi:hypothetical protein